MADNVSEGVDYSKTFDSTMRCENVRLILAEAAAKGLHTAQMDVTTAFLYADLEAKVYMEIPEGMFDQAMPGKVLRLLKALYGLKQSSRMWIMHIVKVLGQYGLTRLMEDFLHLHNRGRRGRGDAGTLRG